MRELLTCFNYLRSAQGVITLICCVVAWVPVHAAPPQVALRVPDVRILLEVSNAAQAADPGQVRGEATSLLASLLPDNGRGGIWVYGDYVSSLVEYGQTDLFWKRLAIVHTRELDSQGEHVDLAAGLMAAAWDADKDSKRQRHIIVVGSGRFQSGGVAADIEQRDQLLNTMARKFAAVGIHIHVVVLPGTGDSQLLRPLAEQTGGLYIKAGTAADLGRAFENLLDRTAAPPSLRVEGGAFTVEPGLAEMTMMRRGDEPDLELVDPSGILRTRASPGANVHWHDARGYDVMTIVKPQPGRWHFRSEIDTRVFALGDLAIQVGDVPATVLPGHFNHVDFMLFVGADAVTDESFLALTRADAELIGETESVPLFVERVSGGIFRVRFSDAINGGHWKLNIGLAGPTFARQVSIPFVLANPVEVILRQEGSDLAVFAEFADASVDHGSLTSTFQVTRTSGEDYSLPATKFPGGLWQIVIPDADTKGEIDIALNFFGRYQNQTPFVLHTDAFKVETPLKTEQFFRFDAKGNALKSRNTVAKSAQPNATPAVHSPSHESDAAGGREGKKSASNGEGVASPRHEQELPIWFVASASILNLLVAVGLGWFLSRRRIPQALQDWLDQQQPEAA
jgi:hypothetical protein